MKGKHRIVVLVLAIAGGFVGSFGWYRWVWVRGEWREASRRATMREQASTTPTPADARTGTVELVTNPQHNQVLSAAPAQITLFRQRPATYEKLQLLKVGTPSASVLRTGRPTRSEDGKTITLPFPTGQGKGTYTVRYRVCEVNEPTGLVLPTPATGSSVGPSVVVAKEQLQGACRDGEFSFTIQ